MYVFVMCVLSQELKAELESRTTALSAQVKMLSQQNQVKLSHTCTFIVTTYLCTGEDVVPSEPGNTVILSLSLLISAIILLQTEAVV